MIANHEVDRKRGRYFIIGALVGTTIAVSGAFVFGHITRPVGIGSTVISEPESIGSDTGQSYATEKIDSMARLEPTLQEMVAALESTREFDRPLVLHNQLVDVEVSKLDGLLSQLKKADKSTIHDSIQEAVIQKIAQRDPIHALASIESVPRVRKRALTDTIFAEWSAMDLDSAIEHARKLSEPQRIAALEGVIQSRRDLSNLRLQEIGRQLGNESRVLDEVAHSMVGEPIENPRQLWNSLDAKFDDWMTLSTARKRQMVDVATAFIDQQGADGLQEILTSLSRSTDRVAILGEIFNQIAVHDSNRAFQLAMSVNGLDRDVLETVVRNFAHTDPIAGLEAALRVDAGGNRMQRAVIEAWANDDPSALYESLELLPENLHAWATTRALISMGKTNPEKAAALLENVEQDDIKNQVAQSIAVYWADMDPRSAFAWTRSDAVTQEMGKELQTQLLRRLASTDSSLALELALGEPVGDGEVGLESDVIAAMALIDIDAALSMLDEARNQATRESSYPAIGKSLARRGSSSQAIALVKDLPVQSQIGYFNQIIGDWARTDINDLFNRVDELPSNSDLMNSVANAIALAGWQTQTSFSSALRKFLKKHAHEQVFETYVNE